ncbi:MAG TPA: FecR family protein [Flavobacterium sp.]|uniref:FecR family protein n=1 Tax=unclassified Flavobacterium TaxID=196869 RepID=UPI0025C1C4DF|nr:MULTISPECIES: FecR family protein [unclassified Flavobacterium]HRE76801.1 FecR family protein [Flavobacterium sp.]
MKRSVNQDTYLAKWISGELNDSELKNYVSENDFNSYVLLKDLISGMQSISPDIENTWEQINQKKLSSTFKVNQTDWTLKRFYLAAAAILILFVSIMSYHFGLFGSQHVLTSTQSKKLNIGENVFLDLYQNTSITQSAPLYNINEIELDFGEVYFEVKKGQDFKIKTNQGTVEVLGTKFNVKSNDNFLSVMCFEGSVKVTYLDKEYIVDSGKSFNSIDRRVDAILENKSFNSESGILYHEFKSTRLVDVKTFLEKTYKVKITFPKYILNRKFTGALPINDLELSLHLIASSFQLHYEINQRYVYFKA